MRAASSKRRRFRNSSSNFFVRAGSLLSLNRLPSRRYQMYTAPSSLRSYMTSLSIMLKNDAEQSRCQNTTQFHAVDDGQRSREVAVQSNLAAMLVVQLDNHVERFGGVAKVLHDHLQSLSGHCVKRFFQVYSPLFCLKGPLLLYVSLTRRESIRCHALGDCLLLGSGPC